MNREDHIPADLKENHFVCKLCKTFCGIKQKSLQPDYLKNHKTHKAFYKDYRRRYLVRDFTHTWYQCWGSVTDLDPTPDLTPFFLSSVTLRMQNKFFFPHNLFL
jgi:hypothetical protein